jgi:putative transcriptional regulator
MRVTTAPRIETSRRLPSCTAGRFTLNHAPAETDIHRSTLSKLSSTKGYNCGTDVLDRLCKFFGCELHEIAEYVPDPSAQADLR